jgi:repressor LexA
MSIITDDLTERQYEILTFIVEYQRKYNMPPTVREIGKHLGLASPGGIHRILGVLKDKGYLKTERDKNRAYRFTRPIPQAGIPLVGSIAAGKPTEALNFVDEELPVAPEMFGGEDCFALKVKGDSMIEAHIMEGDLAIIKPQAQVENGSIAAVMVEGLLTEATLKIVKRYRHTLTLVAANPKYEPMAFTGNDRHQVSIVGMMVGLIRR